MLMITLLLVLAGGGAVKVHLLHDYYLIHTHIETEPVRKALEDLKLTAETLIANVEGINEGGRQGREDNLLEPRETGAYTKTISLCDRYLNDLNDMTMGKRSIDILGDLLHTVAGTPSRDMHEELVRKVDTIMNVVGKEGTRNIKLAQKVNILAHELEKENENLRLATQVIRTQKKRLDSLERLVYNLDNLIEFEASSNTLLRLADNVITKIDMVFMEGKNHYLSTHAISPTQMREIVQKAAFEASSLDPLFKKNVEKYYTTKLARVTWEGTRLHVTVKIPLVNEREKYNIEAVTLVEKETAKVPLDDYVGRLKNEVTGGFSYLSLRDIRECNRLEMNELLCQRRLIEIRNADVLVYEISPTLILFDLEGSISKSMRLVCEGEKGMGTEIALEHPRVVKIPENCTVAHESFFIREIRHKGKADVAHHQLNMTVTLMQTKHKQKNETSELLNKLEMNLNETRETMKAFHANFTGEIYDQRTEIDMLYGENETLRHSGIGLTGGVALIIIVLAAFTLHVNCRVGQMK